MATNKTAALKELQTIPGVGPRLAADLYGLGLRRVADLRGRDPQELYERLEKKTGAHIDRCVLYVFRCAVYFATSRRPVPVKALGHGALPEKLKWWNWKDAPRRKKT